MKPQKGVMDDITFTVWLLNYVDGKIAIRFGQFTLILCSYK
jgi:hypothetical protein